METFGTDRSGSGGKAGAKEIAFGGPKLTNDVKGRKKKMPEQA